MMFVHTIMYLMIILFHFRNVFVGNLRNMAIDMGSELENQNNQIDRINRKVSLKFKSIMECINLIDA